MWAVEIVIQIIALLGTLKSPLSHLKKNSLNQKKKKSAFFLFFFSFFLEVQSNGKIRSDVKLGPVPFHRVVLVVKVRFVSNWA